MSALFDRIKMIDFPVDQYVRQEAPKTQIVLHHTASGRGHDGDFSHWLNTPQRIATCVIIDYKGTIHQCFNSRYWGYHIGAGNVKLEQQSIGIEIDAWGPLYQKDGKYYCWTGKEVSEDRVVALSKPFRTIPKSTYFDKVGATGQPACFYEKYTVEQIESVRLLLLYWSEHYGIPLDCQLEGMFTKSEAALNGKPGVWSHSSFRSDKSDAFPQPELIDMFKNLIPQ